MIHLGFFIYYISYVRRGLCDPLFFFFGVRCAQYKVHAQCSFAALAPHMPCMLLVNFGSRSIRGCKKLARCLRASLPVYCGQFAKCQTIQVDWIAVTIGS